MPSNQPFITSSGPRRRRFAASAVAVQAIIVNEDEQVLLLSSPSRKHGWQLVSGALEVNETLLDGALREVHEELGADIRVRPLGIAHAQSFHYDESVRYMLGIYYLFTYLGGEILPGDDMTGSEYRWFSLTDLDDKTHQYHATVMPWMLQRAVELYGIWQHTASLPLQPLL